MNINIKGSSLYILNIPGVGIINAHMNASQALNFVASVEMQLDQSIPRSLRVAPVSIAEIEARETCPFFIDRAAVEQARNALAKALNNSATGATLADAISVLDRFLERAEVQS